MLGNLKMKDNFFTIDNQVTRFRPSENTCFKETQAKSK